MAGNPTKRHKLLIWKSLYLDSNSRSTFLNASRSAKEAGYSCKTDGGFRRIGSDNCKRLKDDIEAFFQEGGLSKDHVLQKLKEGLEATIVKVFNHNGTLVYSKPLPDYATRKQYLELCMKKDGMFAEKRVQELTINVRALSEHQAMLKMVGDRVMKQIIAEQSAAEVNQP
jgi:hypothetical protein